MSLRAGLLVCKLLHATDSMVRLCTGPGLSRSSASVPAAQPMRAERTALLEAPRAAAAHSATLHGATPTAAAVATLRSLSPPRKQRCRGEPTQSFDMLSCSPCALCSQARCDTSCYQSDDHAFPVCNVQHSAMLITRARRSTFSRCHLCMCRLSTSLGGHQAANAAFGAGFRHDVMHKSDFVYSESKSILLREVVRASAAAPTFLPAAVVSVCNNDTHAVEQLTCIDGGVAANNPSQQALTFALSVGCTVDDVALLSLGTGAAPHARLIKAQRSVCRWMPCAYVQLSTSCSLSITQAVHWIHEARAC